MVMAISVGSQNSSEAVFGDIRVASHVVGGFCVLRFLFLVL
jgi:hypothetical protein